MNGRTYPPLQQCAWTGRTQGHNTDEEFTIDVKFPEEYQAENLKGKDAQFKIKLHEIKKKELPEVDDEFVKDVSEKETLDEYKEEIKEKTEEKVKEILDKLRPFIINDGGNIEFVKIEDDIVYIKMLGACANCQMLDFTLKDGIEAAIINEVPEIKGVINVI